MKIRLQSKLKKKKKQHGNQCGCKYSSCSNYCCCKGNMRAAAASLGFSWALSWDSISHFGYLQVPKFASEVGFYPLTEDGS